MLIAFTLTMPGVASWNGRWTGEGRLYCIVKNFRGKKQEERAKELLKKAYWSHSWDDGWRASIEAKQVDAKEAARLRRKSNGFCGYDWMVNRIIDHGSTEEKLLTSP